MWRVWEQTSSLPWRLPPGWANRKRGTVDFLLLTWFRLLSFMSHIPVVLPTTASPQLEATTVMRHCFAKANTLNALFRRFRGGGAGGATMGPLARCQANYFWKRAMCRLYSIPLVFNLLRQCAVISAEDSRGGGWRGTRVVRLWLQFHHANPIMRLSWLVLGYLKKVISLMVKLPWGLEDWMYHKTH